MKRTGLGYFLLFLQSSQAFFQFTQVKTIESLVKEKIVECIPELIMVNSVGEAVKQLPGNVDIAQQFLGRQAIGLEAGSQEDKKSGQLEMERIG